MRPLWESFLALMLTALLFAHANASSQGANSVNSVAYATINLYNLTMPIVTGLNSPLLIYLDANNSGAAASGNVTLNIRATGNLNISEAFQLPPLLPSQNDSITILAGNFTHATGEYNLQIWATYASDGLSHSTMVIGANYYVVNIVPQFWPNATFLAEPLPAMLAYVPIYTSLLSEKAKLSQITVRGSALGEFMNMSVGRNYTNLVSLSSNSIYLPLGATQSIQLLFSTPNYITQPTAYEIPITFYIQPIGGKRSNVTEYMTMSVYNSIDDNPAILSDVAFLNFTNTTEGTIQVQNGNTNATGALLETILAPGQKYNLSYLSTAGFKSDTSEYDGKYLIKWNIPYMKARQSIFGYYTINSIESQSFPFNIDSMLVIPSSAGSSGLLHITNLSIPSIYVNSIGEISLQLLYTGLSRQNVSLQITPQSGVSVYNSTQSVNITPNQPINESFRIATGKDSGTFLLALYVTTKGANITYSLPLLVLQQPTQAPPQQNILGLFTIPKIPSKEIKTYAGLVGTIIIMLLILYVLMLIASRARYSSSRAKELRAIKEQIRREGDKNG